MGGVHLIFKKKNLNNTNDNILEEIKTDDIDNENDKTINEFYTEQPSIIFNDIFRRNAYICSN